MKKREGKMVNSIEKFYLQLKKFLKQNREVLQISIRRETSKKSRKYKKNKRLLPRKYSRIIDEVNSIKEGVGFISIIELIYNNGQFHLSKIKRHHNKHLKVNEDRDSIIWKLLAKKKHQTPKSLFEVYQNALRFPQKKKIHKLKNPSPPFPVPKKKTYVDNACDYCQQKGTDLVSCDYCDKFLHLKCLKYFGVPDECA